MPCWQHLPRMAFPAGICLDTTAKHQSANFCSQQPRSSCTVNMFSEPSSDGSGDAIKHASHIPNTCLLLGRCCNTAMQLLHIEHILWVLPFTLCMNVPFWIVAIWGHTPLGLSGPHLASALRGGNRKATQSLPESNKLSAPSLETFKARLDGALSNLI